MPAVRPIPEGYHSLTPQLTCRDAAKAIEFYKRAFGAKELARMPGPSGKVMHAELEIGNSRFFVNDEMPGMTVAPAQANLHPYALVIYTEDADAMFARSVEAGAQADMPVALMLWGDRYGKLTDPFGHQWGLATHVEDVAPEEMQRRMDEMNKQMSAKASGASN